MGTIFAYFLTSSIILTSMYLIYKWALADENQHAYNRAIIAVIYFCTATAPFLITPFNEWIENIPNINNVNTYIETGNHIEISDVDFMLPLMPRILIWVYTLGVIIAIANTIIIVIKLARIINSGERHSIGKYSVVVVPTTHIAPFSWLKFIVLCRDDYESSSDMIITHESHHLKLYHWIDLFIAQMIVIFQWFNPTAWLMREELKNIHEYQADEAVIASGVNPKDYQMLLIKKAVGSRFPSLANSLNHSKLKKRVTMMYKSKSSVGRRLCALALIPAGVIAAMATNLPVVSSAINEVSETSFTLHSADKDTKNEQHSQKLKVNGKVVSISGKKSPVVTSTSSSSDLPIYINGKKQEPSFTMNSIQSSDIESVSIVKNGDNPGIYIVLKGNNATKAHESSNGSIQAK